MRITYYGHSTFGVATAGKHLIFDPFITPNGLAQAIDINTIPADYVLVSHGHGDHLADAEAIMTRTGATLLANYEIVSWYEQKGINKNHPFNHGGKANFDFGTVKLVNAVHSSTLPDGSNGGNPTGFLVWNNEGSFYFAGDTALTMDMKLIPMFCPKLNFAILPIGDNFTMGYEDALIASDFIECDTIIGCHFDTFGYIKIDHEKAQQAFAEKGKKLLLLAIGESVEL